MLSLCALVAIVNIFNLGVTSGLTFIRTTPSTSTEETTLSPEERVVQDFEKLFLEIEGRLPDIMRKNDLEHYIPAFVEAPKNFETTTEKKILTTTRPATTTADVEDMATTDYAAHAVNECEQDNELKDIFTGYFEPFLPGSGEDVFPFDTTEDVDGASVYPGSDEIPDEVKALLEHLAASGNSPLGQFDLDSISIQRVNLEDIDFSKLHTGTARHVPLDLDSLNHKLINSYGENGFGLPLSFLGSHTISDPEDMDNLDRALAESDAKGVLDAVPMTENKPIFIQGKGKIPEEILQLLPGSFKAGDGVQT